MTLDERLIVCQMPNSHDTLRNRRDMNEIIERLPMEHQLDAIKFMEYLQESDVKLPHGHPGTLIQNNGKK